MNQRALIDRLLSPAGLGLVLLLFLFPFVVVSCGVKSGQASANFEQRFTFTGVDLLVGGSPDITVAAGADGDAAADAVAADEEAVMAVFDERYGKYYPPQPLAIGAAVIIFVGMILAIVLPAARRAWLTAGAGVVAAVLLAVEVFVIAPGLADDAIADGLAAMDEASAAIPSEALTSGTAPGLGFWIAIVLLVGLAAWQAYVARHSKSAAGPPDWPPQAGQPQQAAAPSPPPAGGPAPAPPQSDGTPPG